MTDLKNKIWANTWPPSTEPLTFFCYDCLSPLVACSCLVRDKRSSLDLSDTHKLNERTTQAITVAAENDPSTAVVLLRELIRDIETKADKNGKEYPGVYPHWNNIASYVKAKEFLETQP